jgi:hypothetical protein
MTVSTCCSGMGEQELDIGDDFSRVGRVNAMLARRLELLAQVGGWGAVQHSHYVISEGGAHVSGHVQLGLCPCHSTVTW